MVRSVVELPAGVVTFVFTDIEGSTRLFRDLGDRYPPLLELHNAILHEVWVAHSGAEVKTEGDAFFVAFADPCDAVRACVEAVERIDDYAWPPNARFRIRAGMHTGVAFPREGDYIAFPVHQAARVGGVGHGGQVVVSPATAELVGELEGVRLHDLGSYRVRDFDEAIHLYQAEHAAEPTPHPALRTAADVKHNLPSDVTELIGRRNDLAGVEEQMGQSRLVSLLGPGGVGKTTLALTTARRAVDQHADGVWFVDLSAQNDAATVRGAIADLFGVGSEEITEALGGKELLLVLDNCEQAVDAVAEVVADLMEASASVSFLVTSREPLAISSERLWRLEPFSGSESAVALFAARAQAVAPGFDADAHRKVIAEICRRLDGLPLAIELAAARVTAMSPVEILDSLTDVLRVLRSRRRDLDPRQRTATGLVDWSYQLLDDDERMVLRHLGVFRDDFHIESVTAAVEGSGLDRIDIADIVWSLVEKSLVMPVAVAGGTRYRMLETTRAFAQQSLMDEGERHVAEAHLGEWYRIRFDPTAPHDAGNAAQLFDEQNNIRALANDLADHDPSLGQWLTWVLGVHFRRTDPARGIAELTPLIEHLDVPGEAIIGMRAIKAQLHLDCGDTDAALAVIETSERYVDPNSHRLLGEGWMAAARAWCAVLSGDPATGRRIAEAAVEGSIELERISLLNTMGVAASELGELEAAREAFAAIIVKAKRLHHPTFEATTLETWPRWRSAAAISSHRLSTPAIPCA